MFFQLSQRGHAALSSPFLYEVTENGDQGSRQKGRGHFARHKGYGHALEDGVEEDYRRSHYHGCSRKEHGPEADYACLYHCLFEGHPLGELQVNEIDEDYGVSHHNAGSGNETDHGGGGKEGPENRMTGKDADEAQGDGGHDNKGDLEGFEPSHHHNVDEDQDGAKGKAQITEDFVTDMPLPIPFDGILSSSHGWMAEYCFIS